ncbi:hypothetical protein ACFV1U_05710 [Streptomyces microflavus]|uniref:hypothetical protein n=1 Tax=Streptomyces microflavus TaxID=1919 RepID=UPI0036AF3917
MRISTGTRWILTTALCGVLITGCSSEEEGGAEEAKARTAPTAEPKPLGEGALRPLLLSQADLGTGYVQVQDKADTGEFDDVAIQGCPSLEKLGEKGDEPMFASMASTGFTYDTDATIGEELHSDRPSVLSSKLRELFGAYTDCPNYTMTAGTTPIEVKVSKSDTPELGDEQFAYTSTMELPSGAQIVKTTAVRKGNIAVMLVGAPALVDRHIATAVDKLPAES